MKTKLVKNFFILAIFFLLPNFAHAAAITSAQSGNWSQASTWVGGALPGDGDRAVIATGHNVTVDQDTVVGSSASSVGNAIRIKATDQNTFGRLIVSDGVKLTLKGYSLSTSDINGGTMGVIEQYAVLKMMPGSTLIGEISSNVSSGIYNYGIIDAVGTAEKPILFTIPIADRGNPWAGKTVAGSRHFKVSCSGDPDPACAKNQYVWDGDKHVGVLNINDTYSGNNAISNSAGTDIGTFDDTSVVFSNKNPSTVFVNSKSSLEEVLSAGDYYIDHNGGFVYFFTDYVTTPTVDVNYSYLNRSTATWRGWFIDIEADTQYNEGMFEHCIFEYVGQTNGNNKPFLKVNNKKSASVESNRIFYVKNSLFRYCGEILAYVGTNTGAPNDPLLFDSNRLHGVVAGSGITGDPIYVTGATYLTFNNNIIYGGNLAGTGGPGAMLTGLKFTNNKIYNGGMLWYDFMPVSGWMADGEISDNLMVGGVSASNIGLLDVGGYPGHPLVIKNNIFKNFETCIDVDRSADIHDNIFQNCYNAGVRGEVGSPIYSQDVSIHNNIFVGPNTDTSAFSKLSAGIGAVALHGKSVGYHMWIDNWQIYNNTISNYKTGFAIGFAYSGGTTMITRSRFFNNIITKSATGIHEYSIQKAVDFGNSIVRGNMALMDYNLITPATVSSYLGLNSEPSCTVTQDGGATNYNTSISRNIAGVEIANPSYTVGQTGRNLNLTVNSSSDKTLSWGNGDPVQLVWQADGSSMTSASTQNMESGTTDGTTRIYDSTKNWSTTAGNALSPKGRWLKITSGSGVSENNRKVFLIVGNSSNHVDVLPPLLRTNPAALGDTYEIINSEVKLFDTPGSTGGSIDVGILYEDLPTTSQTDTAINFTYHTQTGSPLLANAAGLAFADMVLQTGSPAIGAGLGGTTIGYTGAPIIDSTAPSAPSGLSVM